jgi:competence ComEA-like helix-hairpin-helix protein
VKSRGSIIIGLLWCLVLVALIVVGFLHSTSIDLQVQKNYGDRIQAHYLALAGIERAKALLYQNARDRSRTRQNHDGQLYDAPDQFRDTALGRGHFRVFRRAREDEGGGVVFGISDEESRLNVNTASTNELEQIDGMNDDVIAAIIAWRSGRNAATPSAAEDDYYLSMRPPYKPRKAPFQTIRELLMVRGVSRDLLFGRDARQNGLLEPAEAGDDFASQQADEADLGWAGIMTVDSSVKNQDATGQDRINIQTADENTLSSVPGITPQIAHAITTYRGQNQFQSIADLLDVTAPSQNNSAQTGTSQQSQSGQGQQGNTGPQVIDQDLLLDIADQLTAADPSQDLTGAININTAGISVLACLPGMDRQLAQAIVSYRQSQGFFANIAWLLEVPGITRDIFKQLAPLITTRSETYRILSEGKVDSTSVRQRIQVIVRLGLHDAQTLSYREDDL